MSALKTQGWRILMVAAVSLLGFVFATWDAEAASSGNKATNSSQLLSRVHQANAGWDYIPRCGDGARWSTSDHRCKGGNGKDDNPSRHKNQRSYRINDAAGLTSRVRAVDAGWDWEPRCANGAHWSWNSNRCKGGTGDDHDDDDD